jgi:plasmid stability protein
MATLVIRNVEDAVHARLKALAASHGRSMEEEARMILHDRQAASPLPAQQGFGQAIRAIFEPLGGLELPETPRDPPRDPPDFSGPNWDPLP